VNDRGLSAQGQNVSGGDLTTRVAQRHSVDQDHALHDVRGRLRQRARGAGSHQQLGKRRLTVHEPMLRPAGGRRRSLEWRVGETKVNFRGRAVRRTLAACGASATLLVSGCSMPGTDPAAGFGDWCTPDDTGLAELSGLVWQGDTGYAIGDRGSDDRLAELNRDCQVTRWIDIGVETVDVEDIAVDRDGIVWLADTGDNDSERDTVALIGVDVDTGARTSVPLSYPDGAHDVEAFVLTPAGHPVLVTKVADGGSAVVYTTGAQTPPVTTNPSGLVEPIVLVQGGTVSATAADGKSRPITGAAIDAVGRTGALRTKKELFLFDIAQGDAAGAFTGTPFAVLDGPDQPQGEAVAFTDGGDLLIASEADGAEESGGDVELPPIQVMSPAR
jgi:hypothetical protein